MSQDTDDIDWGNFGEPANYGATNMPKSNDAEEFQDIKISLGNTKSNSTGGYYDKNAKKEDIKLGELRKSNASTGDDSGASNNINNRLADPDIEMKANRCCNCLHIDYYQQYFNVTTQDVIQRLTFSLIPVGDRLAQAIGDRPDLYGPFWIYTTLLFLLAFAENMHNFIAVGYEDFQYDFENIPHTFFTIYGVGFGAPLVLAFIMKYVSEGELKFNEITCIYGYSFTSICICVIICAIPIDILQWIAIAAALVVNLGVLFFNLKKEFDSYAKKSKWLFIAGI